VARRSIYVFKRQTTDAALCFRLAAPLGGAFDCGGGGGLGEEGAPGGPPHVSEVRSSKQPGTFFVKANKGAGGRGPWALGPPTHHPLGLGHRGACRRSRAQGGKREAGSCFGKRK
jgi:hypothetical protein